MNESVISQPAIAYVRMSTEAQEYSTENQIARIREYADRFGFEIQRIYADEGISGLTLKGRSALLAVMNEVTSGHAGFEVILVYDVSRWGRFQSPDEAAYYEHTCARAGIKVHYVGEAFKNDGNLDGHVLKAMKRVMAADFSRDLSLKTLRTKVKAAQAGARPGGCPGLGFRRMVVDADGVPGKILELREQKVSRSHKTVLVLGPKHEVETVRNIFRMFVEDKLSMLKIALKLNVEGIARSKENRIWTIKQIRIILGDEKYIGTLLYNRVSSPLKGSAIRNPKSKWIRIERAFPAIVDPEIFARAQDLLSTKPGLRNRPSDEELLDHLRRLLREEGAISVSIINSRPEIPPAQVYSRRFGSLREAYRRIGYEQPEFAELQRLKQAPPALPAKEHKQKKRQSSGRQNGP